MSKTTAVALPICTSCHRIVPPKTKAAKFLCPNCGEIMIWRCQKCRKFARPYSCPKCGFQGP